MTALLNAKQEAFCLAYAKTGNATESYKKAGYNVKTEKAAYSNSNRLLKNDKVQLRLQELAEEMKSTKIAEAREIQEILTSIVRGELTEEVIASEGIGSGRTKTISIMKTPNLKDRIKAGEVLAKMQGAFDNTLKLEMTVPVFGGDDELED